MIIVPRLSNYMCSMVQSKRLSVDVDDDEPGWGELYSSRHDAWEGSVAHGNADSAENDVGYAGSIDDL